jgi:predicted RNase H-like HicB family nuclease
MDIQIPLTIKLTEDKQSKSAPWVAYTPELDLASCGPTPDKAKQNLEEAVGIVLNGAAEDGNLRDLLIESGFEIQESKIKPPKIRVDQLEFKINSNLISQIWPA